MESFLSAIEQLQSLALHDQGINRINIDFENDLINLDFTIYSDELSKEIITKFIFNQISNIEMLRMTPGRLYELEIHQCEIKKVNNDGYSLNLMFLQGFGEASVSMSFNFMDCAKG